MDQARTITADLRSKKRSAHEALERYDLASDLLPLGHVTTEPSSFC